MSPGWRKIRAAPSTYEAAWGPDAYRRGSPHITFRDIDALVRVEGKIEVKNSISNHTERIYRTFGRSNLRRQERFAAYFIKLKYDASAVICLGDSWLAT
jgi:hypothetical protein